MTHEIVGRLANAPVMIAPHMGIWAGECLQGLIKVERLAELTSDHMCAMASADDFWPADDDWRSMYRPYNVTNGVLAIPVKGMMIHDLGWQIGNWATGYIYIRKAVERGLADGNVHTICFVINSGGGEVSGNFDLVDFIYEARQQKRIEAIVNEHSYSAAYSIASAAHRITVARTGGVGSVGVYTMHVNQQKWLERIGLEVTIVFAGDHKVDGNPYEKLSEAAKKRMQARIDALYNVFTSTVSRNLGIDEEVVRGTQALTYTAEEAVEIGFAHSIKSWDEAWGSLIGGQEKTEIEDYSMSTKPEDVQAAHAADVAAARAEGVKAGAQAERTRIQGILTSAEAQGRGNLATHLAMSTDMTVEAAVGILTNSPVEKVEKPAAEAEAGKKPDNAFIEAMGKTPNPEVGAEGGQDSKLSAAEQILADYRAATGATTTGTTH